MVWGYCGPKLITDLVRSYCFGKVDPKKPLKSCKDITILPPQAIQPVNWDKTPSLFEAKEQENDLQFQQVRAFVFLIEIQ